MEYIQKFPARHLCTTEAHQHSPVLPKALQSSGVCCSHAKVPWRGSAFDPRLHESWRTARPLSLEAMEREEKEEEDAVPSPPALCAA